MKKAPFGAIFREIGCWPATICMILAASASCNDKARVILPLPGLLSRMAQQGQIQQVHHNN
jgi:hypothetical protein